MIDAVELGLSCDTDMASQVSELNPYPFLTNSDAHSLGKIGREYNELYVQSADFTEFALALKGNRRYGRRICGEMRELRNFTKGVSERLRELSDQLEDRVPRPRYVHQIPLQFVPGVGPKTLDKLKKPSEQKWLFFMRLQKKIWLALSAENRGAYRKSEIRKIGIESRRRRNLR